MFHEGCHRTGYCLWKDNQAGIRRENTRVDTCKSDLHASHPMLEDRIQDRFAADKTPGSMHSGDIVRRSLDAHTSVASVARSTNRKRKNDVLLCTGKDSLDVREMDSKRREPCREQCYRPDRCRNWRSNVRTVYSLWRNKRSQSKSIYLSTFVR